MGYKSVKIIAIKSPTKRAATILKSRATPYFKAISGGTALPSPRGGAELVPRSGISPSGTMAQTVKRFIANKFIILTSKDVLDIFFEHVQEKFRV